MTFRCLAAIAIVSVMAIEPLLSKNNFIYVRYNPEEGNASTIISAIDSIWENSDGKCVIFISNGDEPIIAETDAKWNNAKTWLLSIQVDPEYYPDEEGVRLSRYFIGLFGEKLYDGLHIKGDSDSDWNSTFIVPAGMYNEESEYLYLTILSNELAHRQSVAFMVYGADGNSLSSLGIPNKTIYE